MASNIEMLISKEGLYTFPSVDPEFVQRTENCGWTLHEYANLSAVFKCPALQNQPSHSLFDDVDDVKCNMFLKKLILICDRLCRMLAGQCLPSKSSWMKKMLFSGDMDSLVDYVINCTFVRIDCMIIGDNTSLQNRMKVLVLDVVNAMKLKRHPKMTSNAYVQKAFELGNTLSISELRTILMDALSHACDESRPLTFFPPIRSDLLSAKVESFAKLVFDEVGNIKDVFSCIHHDSYVFLPVRDLEKTKSGRLGVQTMTSFLDRSLNRDLANCILQAEDDIRHTVFELLKSKFPPILRQFVIQNDSLILLRLSNTLLVSQNVHVDNLHGFPHSQFGSFMALNCNQTCHVHLDTTKVDFEFIAPKMVESILNAFKSGSYYHAGMSCRCDGKCDVAATWYQDCVLQHSTGSIRQYSSNTNSFTNAFDALCMSRIPSVNYCGGCRLELLVSGSQCMDLTSEIAWCDACKVHRCQFCKAFNLRERDEACNGQININSELERSQYESSHSEARFKPVCTHISHRLRTMECFEYLLIIMTLRQQEMYSKNCRHIIKFIYFFKAQYLHEITFSDVMEQLGVKCARSFVLSTVFFCTYIDCEAVSLHEFINNINFEKFNIKELYLKLRVNEIDPQFLRPNCKRFLQILTVLLNEGAHLRCTANTTAESATCACGIRSTWKPEKEYMKQCTTAMTIVDGDISTVKLMCSINVMMSVQMITKKRRSDDDAGQLPVRFLNFNFF